MSGLFYLIPIALVMGLGALAAFLWALRSGQYEDLEGAGERILEEDDARLEQSRIRSSRPLLQTPWFSAMSDGKVESTFPDVAPGARDGGTGLPRSAKRTTMAVRPS